MKKYSALLIVALTAIFAVPVAAGVRIGSPVRPRAARPLTVTPTAPAPTGVDIGSLAWDRANIATLRSANKADVLAFFNQQRSKSRVTLPPLTDAEIDQFRWADLAGSGRYHLVTTSSYPCVTFVAITNRDASGKVRTVQTVEGWADLKTGIRDLNGDGKDELIIQKPLVEYDCADVTTWPAVYRLKKERYVEASRDFPRYYDDEVLPKLDAEIGQYRAREAKAGAKQQWNSAGLIMVRDKILRVLGRDPTAGLNQAYQWMNSDDPRLLGDASFTFHEIGGHEREAEQAQAEYERAYCKRFPHAAMCRKLPPQ
jgi:hypothetical protein